MLLRTPCRCACRQVARLAPAPALRAAPTRTITEKRFHRRVARIKTNMQPQMNQTNTDVDWFFYPCSSVVHGSMRFMSRRKRLFESVGSGNLRNRPRPGSPCPKMTSLFRLRQRTNYTSKRLPERSSFASVVPPLDLVTSNDPLAKLVVPEWKQLLEFEIYKSICWTSTGRRICTRWSSAAPRRALSDLPGACTAPQFLKRPVLKYAKTPAAAARVSTLYVRRAAGRELAPEQRRRVRTAAFGGFVDRSPDIRSCRRWCASKNGPFEGVLW